MTSRRRFAYLTPEDEGTVEVCRPLIVPATFEPLVTGALATLTEAHNYEQISEGALTPEECAEIMAGVLNAYLTAVCEEGGGGLTEAECYAPTRINRTTGKFERWDAGLEEWVVPDGETLWPDTTTSPERAAEQDPLCLAAANAANVLLTLYQEVLDDWQNQIQEDVAFADVLVPLIEIGLDIAGQLYGSVTTLLTFFGALFDALAVATQDTTDERSQNMLTCFLLDYLSIVDDDIIVDYGPLRTDMVTTNWYGTSLSASLFQMQMGYLVSMIGEGGIRQAAATTAIETFNCETACEPEPQPNCADTEVTFDMGKPSWVLVGSGHIIALYPAAVHDAAVGRTGAGSMRSTLAGNEHAADMLLDLGDDCTLEYVSFWCRTTSYGGGTSFPYYIQVYNAAGSLLHSYGGPQNVTTNWIKREVWYGASGLANARYVRLLIVTLPAYAPAYLDDVVLTFH